MFPQELVELVRIRHTPPNPYGLPRSLDIIGADFRAVDEVLINDMVSPDVMIMSKTRLIAQLPDPLQRAGTVSSVKVTSRKLTITQRSMLKFRVADQPGRVSGIMRLMQAFLKLLFTTPGTDIWRQGIGGAALSRVGTTMGADGGKGALAEFVVSVDTAKRQMVAEQSKNMSLPADERLLSARVAAATFNKEAGAVMVSIELTSHAGRDATANLEL